MNTNASSLGAEPVKDTSPIENLLYEFDMQKDILYDLVRVLNGVSNRISANTPQEENANKMQEEKLPFNDGHLMSFYKKLQANKNLLDEMTTIVYKINSMV